MKWIDYIALKAVPLQRVAGVQALVQADGTLLFHGVVLRRVKKILQLEASFEEITLDRLLPAVAGMPVFLSIDGRGVLLKEIKPEEEDGLLGKEKHAFYIVPFVAGQQQFRFIARKSHVDDICASLEAAGLFLAGTSLGFATLDFLIPFLKQERIVAGLYLLQLSQGKAASLMPTDGSKAESHLEIGDEKLSSSLAVAYASALGYMLAPRLPHALPMEHPLLWQHKKLYSYLLPGLLTFFFLLFLGNFFLNQEYAAQVGNLQQQALSRKHQIRQLEGLRLQLKQQEKIRDNLQLGVKGYHAYYADRLAASKPQPIKLLQLQIFPFVPKKGKTEGYYQHHTLLVKGLTTQPMLLNEWLQKLEAEAWVKEISDQQWSTTSQQAGLGRSTGSLQGSFSFTVHLNLPQP